MGCVVDCRTGPMRMNVDWLVRTVDVGLNGRRWCGYQ